MHTTAVAVSTNSLLIMTNASSHPDKAFKEGLQQHIPSVALEYVMGLLHGRGVHLRVTRERKTKSGDFRPGTPYHHHRISVNGNLPRPVFLFVLLHEIAHLVVWENHGRVKPHGPQWQQQFREYVEHCLNIGAFPPELETPVYEHVKKGYASTATNPDLYRLFLNLRKENVLMVDDLKKDEKFVLPDGRVFRKGEKLRKRIKCYCLNNKKHYLFQPHAAIERLEY